MRRDSSLRAVVEAAQRGEHAAWSELVARFQDFAVGMAVACSGDWDAAPDAAQEAFGLAFRKLDDLEDPDVFAGWFATLVRTACSRRTLWKRLAVRLDRRRRRGRPAPARSRGARCRRRRAASRAGRDRGAARTRAGGDRAALPRRPHLSRTRGVPRHQPRGREEAGVHRSPTTRGVAAHGDRRTLRGPAFAFPTGSAPRSCCSSRSVIATSRPSPDSSGADPALVHATEDWSTDEALAAGLQFTFAGRASALIRAAQTGDVDLVRLLVEAGAPVRDLCDCAGAESPLWAATVVGDRAVVEYLLDAGADPTRPRSWRDTASRRHATRPPPSRTPPARGRRRPRSRRRLRAYPRRLARAPPTRLGRPGRRIRVRTHRYPRPRPVRAAAPRTGPALAARGRARANGAPVRDRGRAATGRVLARRLRARSVQPGRRPR